MIEKLAVVLVVVTLSIVQHSVVLRVDRGLIICLIFASTSSSCFECCMDFR